MSWWERQISKSSLASAVSDIASNLASITALQNSFTAPTVVTPSVLTPTAGTITGGTKTGYTKKINTDLYYFAYVYLNWTQNTSTSTHYLFTLPITTNLTLQVLSAVDLSTGLQIPSWINATTTGRLQVSKAATSAVNILVSGSYLIT